MGRARAGYDRVHPLSGFRGTRVRRDLHRRREADPRYLDPSEQHSRRGEFRRKLERRSTLRPAWRNTTRAARARALVPLELLISF